VIQSSAIHTDDAGPGIPILMKGCPCPELISFIKDFKGWVCRSGDLLSPTAWEVVA
jgi:hypothetical protein